MDNLQFDLNKFTSLFDNHRRVDSNISTVVQKELTLSQMSNVFIEGKFRTDFDGNSDLLASGYSFIQLRKNNSGKASVLGGYGIAWRPSSVTPATYVINNIESTSQDNTVTITLNVAPPTGAKVGFFVSHGGFYPFLVQGDAEGNDITVKVVSSIGPTPGGTVRFSKPNVFIVDYDDYTKDNYVHEQQFGLNYIQAGYCLIEPNTDYYFRMLVSSDNALSFYVSDDSEDVHISTPNENSKVVSCPGRTVVNALNANPDNYTSMGISVMNSLGSLWYYDDIRVGSLESFYSVLAVSLNSSLLSNTVNLYLDAFGSGSDGNGVVCKAYNTETEKWDTLIDHTQSSLGGITSLSFDKNKYEQAGFIDFKIHTTYPSSASTPSKLTVNSIELRSVEPVGESMGGFVDIYIDDHETFSYDEDINIRNSDFYELSDSSIVALLKVYSGDTELAYGSDYIVTLQNEHVINSVDSVYRFQFDRAHDAIRIVALKSPNIQGISDEFKSNGHYRLLGQNVKVMHKSIYRLRVSISGSEDDDTLTGLVESYIMSMVNDKGSKVISVVDVERYLYSRGYFNLGTIKIYYTIFDSTYRAGVISRNSAPLTLNKSQTVRIMHEED